MPVGASISRSATWALISSPAKRCAEKSCFVQFRSRASIREMGEPSVRPMDTSDGFLSFILRWCWLFPSFPQTGVMLRSAQPICLGGRFAYRGPAAMLATQHFFIMASRRRAPSFGGILTVPGLSLWSRQIGVGGTMKMPSNKENNGVFFRPRRETPGLVKRRSVTLHDPVGAASRRFIPRWSDSCAGQEAARRRSYDYRPLNGYRAPCQSLQPSIPEPTAGRCAMLGAGSVACVSRRPCWAIGNQGKELR